MRHELKSTHKYYRTVVLSLPLQIWIFECCSKVDEDIAIRVADSIPRILNWKTIAQSPWNFVVSDIGQRSLEVYDSFPARGGVNLG